MTIHLQVDISHYIIQKQQISDFLIKTIKNMNVLTKMSDDARISSDLIVKKVDGLAKPVDYFQYSSEEQFTGKYWLDGKKIYIRTLEINDQSQKHGLNNVSTIVGFEAFKYSSSTYGRIDVSKDITIQSESIYLTCSADYTIYLTIRYTKTTD